MKDERAPRVMIQSTCNLQHIVSYSLTDRFGHVLFLKYGFPPCNRDARAVVIAGVFGFGNVLCREWCPVAAHAL